MKITRLHLLLLFIFGLCRIVPLVAQSDTSSAVLTVLPSGKGGYEPRFSPFCPGYCWLGDQLFDLRVRRFLPADSTQACLPENARRRVRGSDLKYPRYLFWNDDPFDNRYLWAYEYWHDTLVLWRYSLEKNRQDSIISLFRASEIAFGRPGIWVSNHQELVLLDRHTGLVMNRIGRPEEGLLMRLTPWGEDVVVTDRWLYQRTQNRYVRFFPLPTDMEGCRSPDKIEFQQEVCVSRTLDAGNKYVNFLVAPDHMPIRLPFSVSSYYAVLGVNPPLVWFHLPDRLIAIDFITGDSTVYPGRFGEPLFHPQNGRHLGFRSEKGFTFFDKNTCQFRMLTLPFGYEIPRNFTSHLPYIYLTYEDRWDLLDFSKLDTVFKRSTIFEEFEDFDREQAGLRKKLPEDFYTQYGAYITLFSRYEARKNPKIEAFWHEVANRLEYCLFQAPDSVLERVAADYRVGRFHPNVACEIVQALFNYWDKKNNLEASLGLLQMEGNAACIENNQQYGEYYIAVLKNTQHRIDSVQAANLSPDARLYALGRVWWDYGISREGMDYTTAPPGRLEKSTALFKALLKAYPESPWADNAAYDTLHFIDYIPSTTDDFTPRGDDNKAFRAFSQFLKNYPDSDRKPDVLLRMAFVVTRGVYDENYNNIDKENAAQYLQTIAQEHPEFAKNSRRYREFVSFLNQQRWSERWSISFSFDREKYTIRDTVRMIIRLQNRSELEQTLDSTFLKHWHEGLKLTLSGERGTGCEGLWGDFPLIPQTPPAEAPDVSIAPGSYYSATFLLGQKSLSRNYGGETFELAAGNTYQCTLEFRHSTLTWFWVSAENRAKFTVE